MRRLKNVREIYEKFMDVLRDIDIDSLTYAEMEQVARICSTVKILGEKAFQEVMKDALDNQTVLFSVYKDPEKLSDQSTHSVNTDAACLYDMEIIVDNVGNMRVKSVGNIEESVGNALIESVENVDSN